MWAHNALAIATEQCRLCGGIGVIRRERIAYRKVGVGQMERRVIRRERPCGCVLRNAFRICFHRYREIRDVEQTPVMGAILAHGVCFSRPAEEYLADFEALARRELTAWEYATFRRYFLDGVDHHVCAAKCGLDRGQWWHMVYRIEERLGRAMAEAQPYPLFPPREYFAVRALPALASSAERCLGRESIC